MFIRLIAAIVFTIANPQFRNAFLIAAFKITGMTRFII